MSPQPGPGNSCFCGPVVWGGPSASAPSSLGMVSDSWGAEITGYPERPLCWRGLCRWLGEWGPSLPLALQCPRLPAPRARRVLIPGGWPPSSWVPCVLGNPQSLQLGLLSCASHAAKRLLKSLLNRWAPHPGPVLALSVFWLLLTHLVLPTAPGGR